MHPRGGELLKLALVLSPTQSVVADHIRGLPGCEIVLEIHQLSRDALASLLHTPQRPAVVIVDEDLAEPGSAADITLTDFIYALRRANMRVIFIATRSQPGDPLLADLVRLDVTDILNGKRLNLSELERQLERKTPLSEVAHLLEVDAELPTTHEEPESGARRRLFTGFGRRFSAATSPPAPPGNGSGASPELPRTIVREVVKEVVREKVVERIVPGDSRSLIAVLGLGPTGVGATTVAVNLAYAMASGSNRVALVDLDPAWSAIPIVLGLEPQDGIGGLLTPEPLTDIGQNKRGVTVFGSLPYPNPPRARSLSESDVLYLIDRLGAFDRVIVDVGHDQEHPVTRALLRMAQKVVLVTDLDANHVLISAHKLAVIRQVANPGKLQLVVNNIPDGIGRTAVREATDLLNFSRDVVKLPYTPQAVSATIQGEPLMALLSSDQPYAVGICTLAGVGEATVSRRAWWPFHG